VTLPPGSTGVYFWAYNFGPVYNYFFILYQMIPLIYVLGIFVAKYLRTKLADLRAQIKYFIIGIAIPIVIGIPTGIILPQFGVVLPPHNHILTLLMSIFLAIGIVKYKFLTLKPLLEEPAKILFSKEAKKYKLDFSKCYIVDTHNSTNLAYEVFISHIYQNRVGLIITHQDPKQIRQKYQLKRTSIVAITDTETDELSIGPHDMEQLLETMTNFVRNHPNSYIILDGISYLECYNGFRKLEYFLNECVQEICSEKSTLMVPMGDLILNRKQRYLFEKDFVFIPSRKYLYETKHITEFARIKPSALKYIILDYNPTSRSIIHEFMLRGIKSTLITDKHVDVDIERSSKVIKSNPLNKYVIHKLGIDHENFVIVMAFDNDPDTILAINTIRDITEKAKIIAKINKEKFIAVAKRAGANEVIPASAIGGKLMALALTTPDIVEWVMDSITFKTTELELMEFDIDKGSRFVDKDIRYLDTAFKDIANILAVNRAKEFNQVPDPDYKLEAGDKVIMVADLIELKKNKPLYKLLEDKIESPLHRRKKG
jgi:Trk K+ transport system NAD-binding subunit